MVAKKKTTKKKASAARKTSKPAEKTTKQSASKKSPAKPAQKKPVPLGRPRIPVDADLDLVFENDTQARDAFRYLEIGTVRELIEFSPDELVQKLTSPAKQTVGRIRQALAHHNRALSGDEPFVLDFNQDQD